jgi:hypothetical protein
MAQVGLDIRVLVILFLTAMLVYGCGTLYKK